MTKEKLQRRYDGVRNSRIFMNVRNSYDLSTKRVLDIGCAYGEFLPYFGPKSIGLTVSQDEVAAGAIMGVDVRIGNIEEVELDIGTFNVIFANNIFEHMLAPHTFLQRIKRYASPNGILILGVPVVPYCMPLTYLSRFSGYNSPSHVNFFTRYTLQRTVEQAGWVINKNSGFYFLNPLLDEVFHYVCPHFYVVARIDPNFEYDDKRKRELAGYATMRV